MGGNSGALNGRFGVLRYPSSEFWEGFGELAGRPICGSGIYYTDPPYNNLDNNTMENIHTVRSTTLALFLNAPRTHETVAPQLNDSSP